MRKTIPDEHQKTLIAAGYVREVVRNSMALMILRLRDEE
jgi:hypothetical protein